MGSVLALFLLAATSVTGVNAAWYDSQTGLPLKLFKNLMTIFSENEDASNVLADPYFGKTVPSKGYLLTHSFGVALHRYSAVSRPPTRQDHYRTRIDSSFWQLSGGAAKTKRLRKDVILKWRCCAA
ncbi:hypothetical protein BJ742DRAFT_866059 [Cladochytrium replicatum]|nr:hypothetical protein BJ742DRAFT_866059 [Cladochytrium replicatum]